MPQRQAETPTVGAQGTFKAWTLKQVQHDDEVKTRSG
jgi:hypothetical protein